MKLFVRRILTIALLLVGSCGPVPERDLSVFERQADLMWLFSIIDHNYAPLKYKEKRHQFDYDKLKEDSFTKVSEDMSNEDFYLLVSSIIAKFQDAHMGVSFNPSTLPERTEVSYLGFRGKRQGKTLLVTNILPTNKRSPSFPVKENDIITKVNGKKIEDVVWDYMKNLRRLGNKTSTLSVGYRKYFFRVLIGDARPSEQDVELTLIRGNQEITVSLPWVTKDYYEFKESENKAVRAEVAEKIEKGELDPAEGTKYLKSSVVDFKCFNELGYFSYEKCPEIQNFIRNHAGFDYAKTFQKLPEEVLSWKSSVSEMITENEEANDPYTKLKSERKMAFSKIKVEGMKVIPAYLISLPVKDTKLMMGYIRIPSFSLPGAALADFRNALTAFKTFGAKEVILDLMDNGGGSLDLGLRMVQSLTNEKMKLPTIALKASETWKDSLKRESLFGADDAIKERKKRTLKYVLDAIDKRESITASVTTDNILSSPVEVNRTIKKGDFTYHLMINEYCASMCDIFSAAFKDNNENFKLGFVYGDTSMGAGGNVVTHYSAPNSHFSVRMTESLLYRKDYKTPIENNGIKPHYQIDTSLFRSGKFETLVTLVAVKAVQIKLGREEMARKKAEEARKKAEAQKKAEEAKKAQDSEPVPEKKNDEEKTSQDKVQPVGDSDQEIESDLEVDFELQEMRRTIVDEYEELINQYPFKEVLTQSL